MKQRSCFFSCFSGCGSNWKPKLGQKMDLGLMAKTANAELKGDADSRRDTWF